MGNSFYNYTGQLPQHPPKENNPKGQGKERNKPTSPMPLHNDDIDAVNVDSIIKSLTSLKNDLPFRKNDVGTGSSHNDPKGEVPILGDNPDNSLKVITEQLTSLPKVPIRYEPIAFYPSQPIVDEPKDSLLPN